LIATNISVNDKQFTENSEDERIGEVSIERQFDEITTQTQRPHSVDESREDVIHSQGLITTITVSM